MLLLSSLVAAAVVVAAVAVVSGDTGIHSPYSYALYLHHSLQ